MKGGKGDMKSSLGRIRVMVRFFRCTDFGDLLVSPSRTSRSIHHPPDLRKDPNESPITHPHSNWWRIGGGGESGYGTTLVPLLRLLFTPVSPVSSAERRPDYCPIRVAPFARQSSYYSKIHLGREVVLEKALMADTDSHCYQPRSVL